jgi:hypothetical protein
MTTTGRLTINSEVIEEEEEAIWASEDARHATITKTWMTRIPAEKQNPKAGRLSTFLIYDQSKYIPEYKLLKVRVD